MAIYTGKNTSFFCHLKGVKRVVLNLKLFPEYLTDRQKIDEEFTSGHRACLCLSFLLKVAYRVFSLWSNSPML